LAYTSRFTFTGDLIIPKNAERFFKEMKGGKNKNIDMASINFGVKESKFNSCFVECFGSVYDTIKIGSDEIPWANRFDEDVVAEAPRYRKYIVDLDGEEKEFLAQYDFVKYLAKVLPEYEGKVECSGRFTKTPYKGQYYDHYEVDTVRASTAVKNSLEVKMDLFYNKDCVDATDFDKTHRIILNAYTKQYINRDLGEKFFPQKVVLDVSKAIATGEEKNIAFAKMMASKVNVKNSEMIHIPWGCKIIRGAETVEFDESMLTDAQKEQIAYGQATIDDFNRQAFGENIYEIRLIRHELFGDFANGPIDSGYSLADVENELASQPVAKETMKDIEAAVESSSVSDIDSALEDLLG